MSYGPSDRAAVLAARLIARDGVRWRDALESVTLECGERPSDDRVATELRRWYSTFDPDQHRRSLRKKRNAALAVMTFFEESLGNVEPKLVGRVLDGAASRDAVAEVVLDTDDEKAPLLAMLNADVRFEELAPQAGENARFAVYLSDEPVLVAVWTRPRLKAHRTRPDPWQHPAVPKDNETARNRAAAFFLIPFLTISDTTTIAALSI